VILVRRKRLVARKEYKQGGRLIRDEEGRQRKEKEVDGARERY